MNSALCAKKSTNSKIIRTRQSEIDQKQQICTAWRAVMAADRLDWSALLLSRDDRAPRTAAFLSGLSIRERSQTFVCVLEEMERLHELVALGELEKIRLRAQVSELEVEHGNLALQLDEETDDDDDDDEAMEAVEPVNHSPSTGPSELRRLINSHVPVILQFPPTGRRRGPLTCHVGGAPTRSLESWPRSRPRERGQGADGACA